MRSSSACILAVSGPHAWIGYMLGIRFQGAIKAYDHWIAFILLGIIGFNMVKESMDNENESCDASIDVKTMLLLAIATSIDALAVGVTFAFLDVRILQAVSFIGCTTFILSVIGVKVGTVFESSTSPKQNGPAASS